MGFLISVHPSDFTRLVVDGMKNQKNPLQSRKHHYLPTSFYYIFFVVQLFLKDIRVSYFFRTPSIDDDASLSMGYQGRVIFFGATTNNFNVP